jgi:hypothetical protein
MMLRCIVLFIAVCWLTACSNSSSSETQSDSLLGRWQWNRTDGGFAGRTYTPATEGYSFAINFSSGSDYSIYRNDTLVRSGAYTILSSNGISHFFIPGGKDSLFMNEVVFAGAMMISHDSLMLTQDSISDGFSSLFIRK